MRQFRGIEILPVIKKAMPQNQCPADREVAAAELALKAHVMASNPAFLAEMNNGKGVLEEIDRAVKLTEAPEDALCSLVIDLIHYCERENIDWTDDVMQRARLESARKL